MKNPADHVQRAARQTRLQTLLLGGTALGTTLLIVATAGPKIPPALGE